MKRVIPLLGIDTRFLRYLWPYSGLLALSIALMVVVAVLEALAPWPIKFIVDNVLGGQPLPQAGGQWLVENFSANPRWLTAALGLALLVIIIVQGAAAFGYDYLNGIIQERATFRLRSDVFSHVQQLPLEFYERKRLGDVLKRVTDDANGVMAALVGSLGELLVNALKFMAFASIMVFVNWHFALLVLAYVPLMLFLFLAFRRNIRATAHQARQAEGRLASLALETMAAIRVVMAFGREAHQQARFDAHGAERVKSALRSRRWEASFSPVVDFIQAASTAAVLWYGVTQILAGALTVGELLIFLAYVGSIYKPLKKFGSLAGDLQKAASGADRLADLLDTGVGIRQADVPRRLARARGDVVFETVSFAYAGSPDRPVLNDFNLRVRAGQVVAVVGATGAGKSTLASLLLRFHDVTGGRILLDGLDVREVALEDLRRQFGLVPQDAMLFAASVRENIAFARPDASDTEIQAAASAANADEFIRRMPQGYDSLIAERGTTLSGGQRQRLAIARALLRNAPVLILDEPTAALDAESEDLVMSALKRLMHGRTTFIIAHRLSTIHGADLIVVLDQGRVVEAGTHNSLLERKGQYARLVQLQARGETRVMAGAG